MKHELWIELERKGKRQLPKCVATGEAKSASEFYNLHVNEVIEATQGWDSSRVTSKSVNGKDKIVSTVYPDDVPTPCSKTGEWSVAPAHNANQEYDPKPEPVPQGALDVFKDQCKDTVKVLDKFSDSMIHARRAMEEAIGASKHNYMDAVLGEDAAKALGYPGATDMRQYQDGSREITYADGTIDEYDKHGNHRARTVSKPIYADERCVHSFGDQGCGLNAAHPSASGAHCDKSFETCRDVFHNDHKFSGMPKRPLTSIIFPRETAEQAAETQRLREMMEAHGKAMHKFLGIDEDKLLPAQKQMLEEFKRGGLVSYPFGRGMGSTRIDPRSYGKGVVEEILDTFKPNARRVVMRDGTVHDVIGDYHIGVDPGEDMRKEIERGANYRRLVLGEWTDGDVETDPNP